MVASQSRGANRKTIIHTEKSSNEGGVCNLKRKLNSSFFVKTVRMSWQKQIENKICGGKKTPLIRFLITAPEEKQPVTGRMRDWREENYFCTLVSTAASHIIILLLVTLASKVKKKEMYAGKKTTSLSEVRKPQAAERILNRCRIRNIFLHDRQIYHIVLNLT